MIVMKDVLIGDSWLCKAAIRIAIVMAPFLFLVGSGTAAAQCQPLSTPTNLQPTGTVPSGLVFLQWSGSPAAYKYWVRIDDRENGWTGTCANVNPGDVCENDVFDTNFTFNAVAGHHYVYWITEVNSCGWYGTSAWGSVDPVCVPKTCATAGVSCGTVADGCGGVVDCGFCPTSDLPGFTVNASTVRNLGVDNQGFYYPPEITPAVENQSSSPQLHMISSSWTYLCTSSGSLLTSSPTQPLTLSPSNCQRVTEPAALDSIAPNGAYTWLSPSAVVGVTPDYKRNYFGILGLQMVSDVLYGSVHGEHHNFRIPDGSGSYLYYQGTIFPNVDVHDCWTGYLPDGTFQTCWPSFASFVSLATSPAPGGIWQGGVFEDHGPVMWPNPAYRNSSGQKTNGGYYHPQLFSDGNYLYIYTINSHPTRPGAQCTVVARAPVSEGGDPGTWVNYYDGSYSEDSLPMGFSRESIEDFYEVPGGLASCILEDAASDAALWFHVAGIKGTPYYVAAEESSPNYQTWSMGVRISADLVNWSPLQVLATSASGWGSGQYTYPTLYDKTGKSSRAVDANELYVVGNYPAGGYTLRSKRLAFTCPAMSTPTNFTATVNPTTGEVTLDWDEPQTTAFYWVRVNDTANPWTGTCASVYPGDICANDIVRPPFTFTGESGHSYSAWVTSVNLCRQWSSSAWKSFSVP